jgi:2-methylcitrate dehydratase PrpD
LSLQAASGNMPADLTEARRIARFALQTSLDSIPVDVQTLAKEHLLDIIGCALASSRFDYGAVILNAALGLGKGDDATAIGSGQRLPATSAALVNGVLAHGLDFDDTHIGAIYHASAQAMAAAFAAGQTTNASGAEVLSAYIVAMEVVCRLATAGAGKFHERSFHPTSLCGTFASACAAGRLQGLDPEAMVSALGLCGSMASGILERGDSWLKRLHPGWAAHSGLTAVALGRAGFLGPDTVFEGRRGFYFAFIGGLPAGAALPSEGLGQAWQTRGIALKPYPCCHFAHAFADAALELRGQFALDEIERIDCPVSAALLTIVAEPRERCIRPTTPYAALFSVPYVVAVALVTGRVDLATFYEEPLDAPAVLRLTAKTFCTEDPASDYPLHFPGEVVVTLRDGRRFGVRKPQSLGTPEVPLAREAIVGKFMALATRAISADAARQLARRVLALEGEASLESIMALTTGENS